MTTTSPWAPQTGAAPVQGAADQRPLPPPPPSQSVPPQPPPAPPPPVDRPGRRPGLWVIVLAMAVLMVVAVAATAAITYAITRNSANAEPPPAPPAATPSEPQFTAAEQNAAKSKLCGVFDATARGQRGQGGVLVNGEVNVPLVLRTVNSVVAVQNTLTPALPDELSRAAHGYIDSSLDLTAAATGTGSVDEVNRLTSESNDATYALADACGLR